MVEQDKGASATTRAVSIRFDTVRNAIRKRTTEESPHNFSRLQSTDLATAATRFARYFGEVRIVRATPFSYARAHVGRICLSVEPRAACESTPGRWAVLTNPVPR